MTNNKSVAENLTSSNKVRIVFVAGRLTKSQIANFCIEELAQVSSMTLIDPSPMLGQNISPNVLPANVGNVIQITRVHSMREAYRTLKRIRPSLVFDLTSTHALGFVRWLLRRSAPFVLIQILGHALPTPKLWRRLRARAYGLFKSSQQGPQSLPGASSVGGHGLLWQLGERLRNSIAQVFSPGPNLILYSGAAALARYGSRRAKFKLELEHPDMELIQSSKKKEGNHPVVFIDEAFATSADFTKLSMRAQPLGTYYEYVRGRLRSAHSLLGHSVLVCLHPDSVPYQAEISRFLPGYELAAGESHAAVASSTTVLVHQSTLGLSAAAIGREIISVPYPADHPLNNEYAAELARVCGALVLQPDGKIKSASSRYFSNLFFQKRLSSPIDYVGTSHLPAREVFAELVNAIHFESGTISQCRLVPNLG